MTSSNSVKPDYTLKTEYSYDQSGNRITEKVSKTQWGSTSVITDLTNEYDANNRLVKQTNTASSWSRSITYQYDENGNMVRKDTPDSSFTTYEYDSENRLKAVQDDGLLLFAALYDGNGDRVFTVVPRQNTGNWHDDWNDGRWSSGETQHSYNDSQWTYGETTTTTITTTTTTTTTTPTTTTPSEEPASNEWDSETVYMNGDVVVYEGKVYKAKWWTQGEEPSTHSGADWQVWELVSGSADEETETTTTTTTTAPTTVPEDTETEKDTETFEVTGNADYDVDMVRDILYIPNGIDTEYLEENYVLTGYINDINTEYTQVLVEYGNTGSYDSVYEYGVQRTTMYQNGEVYSHEYDGRGSVSELVNSIGDTQIKYSYGAYGETISTVIGYNNPVTNPYRYNAERIDDVAGVPAFQYLRARYLNPYTANFLTQDSYLGNLLTPLSQNRYTYAHNNPVMYTDPSGNFIIAAILIGAAVGALVGGGITAYDAATDGGTKAPSLSNIDSEDGKRIVKDALIGGVVGAVAGGVGAGVAAITTAAVGTTTLAGTVTLTASQSIGVGMVSSVAGGMAGRHVDSVLHNQFSPERKNTNTIYEVFNPVAVGFDVAFGGIGGALTHWTTGGVYDTSTSIQRSKQIADSNQASRQCTLADDVANSADDVDNYADDVARSNNSQVANNGSHSQYSGELQKVNNPDPAADALAERIGGESRVKFSNDPQGREFDVISDEYIAQAKPDLQSYGKSWRKQTKATFEAAQATGKKAYFQFEGEPSDEIVRKIAEYSERYGVDYVIDTTPLGVQN